MPKARSAKAPRSAAKSYEGRPSVNKVPFGAPQEYLDPRHLQLKAFHPRLNQNAVLDEIDAHDLTFLVGPAGTGKTVLPVVYALEELRAGRIKKIVATRPAVEAGDSVGFLTGNLQAKVEPYLRPVLDNFEKFLAGGKADLEQLMAQGTIEITSLTYLRGRTIEDAVYIMDEMQNATSAQMKMCLTRMGENCKAIVTMDPGQCDIDAATSAHHDLKRFAKRPGIKTVIFTKAHVVRSRIVKTVLSAYED